MKNTGGVKTLQEIALVRYIKMIREKKIDMRTLEKTISPFLYGMIQDIMVEEQKEYFKYHIHDELKAELMVKTAESIQIDADMHMLWDGQYWTRELVKTINITFKEERLMYILNDDIDGHENATIDNIDMDSIDILMNDCYHELNKVHDNYHIIEHETKEYNNIREYEHPHWNEIYKFAKKHADFDYTSEFDTHEPYFEKYADF